MSIYVLKNSYVARRGAKTDVLSTTRDFQKCKLRSRPANHNLGESQVTDVFYEDHKPILSLLKIMGVMPLQRTETGNNNNTVWDKKYVMITE
jgi:hypothetical protein